MRLMIDISEEDYDFIKTCGNPRIHGFPAIQNGIPLDSVETETKASKTCNRCGAEIKLTDAMPMTPRIAYFSGNAGAFEETVYMCPACRTGFVEWFRSYSLEED